MEDLSGSAASAVQPETETAATAATTKASDFLNN
jgi:hypothetical protein